MAWSADGASSPVPWAPCRTLRRPFAKRLCPAGSSEVRTQTQFKIFPRRLRLCAWCLDLRGPGCRGKRFSKVAAWGRHLKLIDGSKISVGLHVTIGRAGNSDRDRKWKLLSERSF